MRGPAEAVKRLGDFVAIDMPPKALSDVLIEIITTLKWDEHYDADELSEKWINRFKNYVLQSITRSELNSEFIQYSFNSSGNDFIQGICYAEPDDPEEIKYAKLNRSNTYSYCAHFRRIDSLQFESLCGKIMQLLNVEESYVTRASADQGIDFYGKVPFGEIIKPSAINPGAERQLKIWLVGQAKHYSASQVSTRDIRELVGSVSLAKSKIYAGTKDPLAKLQMRNCDPIFYLFFTTGNISRDAMDLLKKSGVIAMDGLQLGVFLADHSIAIENGRFDPKLFDDWISD